MPHDLAPGMWVVNPAQPDWGLGHVQSAVGGRLENWSACRGHRAHARLDYADPGPAHQLIPSGRSLQYQRLVDRILAAI